MPSVRIEHGPVSRSGQSLRWYVWFRTGGGRRRQRVNVYLKRVLNEGRLVHARHVAEAAKAKGVDLDTTIIKELWHDNTTIPKLGD